MSHLDTKMSYKCKMSLYKSLFRKKSKIGVKTNYNIFNSLSKSNNKTCIISSKVHIYRRKTGKLGKYTLYKTSERNIQGSHPLLK